MTMNPAGPSQCFTQRRSVTAGVTLKEGTGTPFQDVGKEKDGCSIDSRTPSTGKDIPVQKVKPDWFIGVTIAVVPICLWG